MFIFQSTRVVLRTSVRMTEGDVRLGHDVTLRSQAFDGPSRTVTFDVRMVMPNCSFHCVRLTSVSLSHWPFFFFFLPSMLPSEGCHMTNRHYDDTAYLYLTNLRETVLTRSMTPFCCSDALFYFHFSMKQVGAEF